MVINNEVNKCIKDGFLYTNYFVRKNFVQSNTIFSLDLRVKRGVWFLRVLILHNSIIFSLVGVVFPVWPSSDRAPKLYLIRFKCVNANLEENHHLIPQRIRRGILKAIPWRFMRYH